MKAITSVFWRTALVPLTTTLTASTLSLVAHAQTVSARCEIYPPGSDRVYKTINCSFLQQPGFIRIAREDGITYELKLNGNQYFDQNGNSISQQQSGSATIFRLVNESVYVYPNQSASSGSVGGVSPSTQEPGFWVVAVPRTFIKVSPGLLSKTITNVPGGTVLRNLGCQNQGAPTWCQVELRDDPSVKGWAWSPNLREYRASSSSSTTSVRPGDPVPALEDLVGVRGGQAEDLLQQRGYEWRNSQKLADSSFSYWFERRTGNCVAIRTTDGRYAAIVYTADQDCNRQ